MLNRPRVARALTRSRTERRSHGPAVPSGGRAASGTLMVDSQGGQPRVRPKRTALSPNDRACLRDCSRFRTKGGVFIKSLHGSPENEASSCLAGRLRGGRRAKCVIWTDKEKTDVSQTAAVGPGQQLSEGRSAAGHGLVARNPGCDTSSRRLPLRRHQTNKVFFRTRQVILATAGARDNGTAR